MSRGLSAARSLCRRPAKAAPEIAQLGRDRGLRRAKGVFVGQSPRLLFQENKWPFDQERYLPVRVLALCHDFTSVSPMRTAFLTLARNASPLNTPKNLPIKQPKNWSETRAAPNLEKSTFRSRMREAIWSTRSRYRMGCPPAVSSMEWASTRLEVGVLAQKIALENNERAALALANRGSRYEMPARFG